MSDSRRRWSKKDIWDKKITAHFAITERLNLVLVQLAEEKKVSKTKVLEEILLGSEEVLNKIDSLKQEGWGV